MVQLIRRFFAQVQADAGGMQVHMAIVPRKASFEDSWQVFRRDADAGVRDGQNLRVRINRNRDLTGSRVFEGHWTAAVPE